MSTDLSASTQRRHRSSTLLFISALGAVPIGAILMGCAGAVASIGMSTVGVLVIRFGQLIALIVVAISVVALLRLGTRAGVRPVVAAILAIFLLIVADWLRDIIWTATLAEFQTTT
jgi:hypothetical protein